VRQEHLLLLLLVQFACQRNMVATFQGLIICQGPEVTIAHAFALLRTVLMWQDMRAAAIAARLALPCCCAVCRSCGMTALVSTSCPTNTLQSWVKCGQVRKCSASVFRSTQRIAHACRCIQNIEQPAMSVSQILNGIHIAVITPPPVMQTRTHWQQHNAGTIDVRRMVHSAEL
jgi:hypothetical protein